MLKIQAVRAKAAARQPRNSPTSNSANRRIGTSSLLAAAMAGLLASHSATKAEDITFAVIGPHEYDLPVNFQPFNVFVQYGEFQSSSQEFDSNGNVVYGPKQDLLVGLSKYVHFWTFSQLPGVGFAYEVIVPEVRVATEGAPAADGIGDTLTGPAIWIKPTPDSTLGFQSFFTAPIGTEQVTNNYFSNNSSLFYDYQAKWFDITGNTGAVFRSDRRGPGLDPLREGTTVFSNIRFGIKVPGPVEPFAGVDFGTTSGSYDLVTHTPVAFSNNHDLAVGAGVMLNMRKDISLTLRYSHSVAGQNTYETNAGYLKFVYLF